MRLDPVAQRRIMSSSSARLCGLSASPESISRSRPSIAVGVLEIPDVAQVPAIAEEAGRWCGRPGSRRAGGARSQRSMTAGPPSASISRSVARLSLWTIIASIERARGRSADRVVEAALAGVDLREIGRRDGDLHRARHREGPVAVEADRVAGRQVERGEAIFAGILGRPARRGAARGTGGADWSGEDPAGRVPAGQAPAGRPGPGTRRAMRITAFENLYRIAARHRPTDARPSEGELKTNVLRLLLGRFGKCGV